MTRGKPFVKGDARINRKGRPKSFDAFRELARAIANEPADKLGEPVIVNDKKATVIEMILRKWATSNNPTLVKAFVEIAYGKVPDRIEVKSDEIRVTLLNDD